MRRTWLWGLIVVALAAMAGTGLVVAQGGSDEGDETDRTGEDATVGGSRLADLNPEEQYTEALRIQSDGTQLSSAVFSMLSEARNEGDVVRTPCLDDVLTQVNAVLNTLNPEVERLEGIVHSEYDNSGLRNHVFTIVTVHGQHLITLSRQANECEGASLYETGTTFVATYRSPTTTVSDPSDLGGYWELEPYLPLPASGE